MRHTSACSDLARELDALGKIYYRRPVNNEGKKNGNIHDFLTNWGRRYRYMVVFDAEGVKVTDPRRHRNGAVELAYITRLREYGTRRRRYQAQR